MLTGDKTDSWEDVGVSNNRGYLILGPYIKDATI